MLWDTEAALQAAERSPSTGLPVEAGMEALASGYRATVDEEKSTSLDRALWDELDAYLDRVEQATGKRLENPIGYAPRQERKPGMTGQLGAQVRLRREQEAPGDPVTGLPGFENALGKLRAEFPDTPPPPTRAELLDAVTRKLALSREARADLESRMTAGGTIASFLGAMGGYATDPLVAATLPFGAGSSRQLVARMAAEAGINAAAELVVQPYVMRNKEAIDSPYGLKDAAANVLAAGALGAVFPVGEALLRAGGSKAVRTVGRVFDRERPVVRPATKDEQAAVNDVLRGMEAEETAPTAPADVPAHLQALDAEIEAVRETGAPSRAVPEVPIEPARAAEVEQAQRLDEVTAREVEALAAEDAELGRVMEEVRNAGDEAVGVRAADEEVAVDPAPILDDPLSDAAVGRPFVIKESEEPISFSETGAVRKIYSVLTVDGAPNVDDARLLASADVVIDGETARIDSMAGLAGGGDVIGARNSLGPREMVRLAAAIAEDNPGVRYIEGNRVSGIRSGGKLVAPSEGQEARVDIRKLAARAKGNAAKIVPRERLPEYVRQARQNAAQVAPDRVPTPDPAEAAKELEAFTGSAAEEAILAADVERALGAKAPPEPDVGAPKPAEPAKPTLDPELASQPIPVAETLDGTAETKTAQELLDELDAQQKIIDEMSSCAAPIPQPKGQAE